MCCPRREEDTFGRQVGVARNGDHRLPSTVRTKNMNYWSLKDTNYQRAPLEFLGVTFRRQNIRLRNIMHLKRVGSVKKYSERHLAIYLHILRSHAISVPMSHSCLPSHGGNTHRRAALASASPVPSWFASARAFLIRSTIALSAFSTTSNKPLTK